MDTVNEFIKVIISSEMDNVIVCNNSDLIIKIANRLHNMSRTLKIANFIVPQKNHQSKKDKIYIAILMGADLRVCLPNFYSNASKNIYLFDAWLETHKTIIDFVNDFKVDNVFVSSSDVVEQLKKYETDTKFHWIPEGISPDDYEYSDYKDKNIDVLQIGRKHDKYHNEIVDNLLKLNKTYLFEKKKGELIFPTRESFIKGLAASKISICFPSSITHPDRTKGIETMTIRYLQSMASKCLIVGKAPREMIELFGYNPVIKVDTSNPSGQIADILDNYENFIPLVEKNYSNLINHKWSNRWKDMKKVILS